VCRTRRPSCPIREEGGPRHIFEPLSSSGRARDKSTARSDQLVVIVWVGRDEGEISPRPACQRQEFSGEEPLRRLAPNSIVEKQMRSVKQKEST